MRFELEVDSREEQAKTKWARQTQYLPFSAEMNFRSFKGEAVSYESVAEVFLRGTNVFGRSFEGEVLARLNEVGYEAVELTAVEQAGAARIEVRQAGRGARTPLRKLSQAQQRTLTLLTYVTLIERSKTAATLLVDDFAEGLDFESAGRLTTLVLEIAQAAPLQFVLATDDPTPLLGLQGTSAVEAPRKGASAQEAQALESALGRFTDLVRRAAPDMPVDLLTDQPRRLEKELGAGAAGGLGYALLLLGARRVSAVEQVLRDCGFTVAAARSDLVVTGAGKVDWSTLAGSVVSGVAAATLETGRPTVLMAGECLVGRRETMSLGLAGTYAVAETPREVEAMVADPVATLAARTARVARTWSPGR